MRAVNADDLIHELDKDGIVEHGYVSVFGIPIIEDCVPVVRCKDCKYYHEYQVMNCSYHVSSVCENWFCSQGRVKE